MTTDMKPILASRTVWANLIGLAAFGLMLLGVPGEAIGDQARLVEAILQVVTGASFIASTAYRIQAAKRLV